MLIKKTVLSLLCQQINIHKMNQPAARVYTIAIIIITQPENWHSFCHPTESKKLSQPSWLVAYPDGLPTLVLIGSDIAQLDWGQCVTIKQIRQHLHSQSRQHSTGMSRGLYITQSIMRPCDLGFWPSCPHTASPVTSITRHVSSKFELSATFMHACDRCIDRQTDRLGAMLNAPSLMNRNWI